MLFNVLSKGGAIVHSICNFRVSIAEFLHKGAYVSVLLHGEWCYGSRCNVV